MENWGHTWINAEKHPWKTIPVKIIMRYFYGAMREKKNMIIIMITLCRHFFVNGIFIHKMLLKLASLFTQAYDKSRDVLEKMNWISNRKWKECKMGIKNTSKWRDDLKFFPLTSTIIIIHANRMMKFLPKLNIGKCFSQTY